MTKEIDMPEEAAAVSEDCTDKKLKVN